jgi:hypothetical protein
MPSLGKITIAIGDRNAITDKILASVVPTYRAHPIPMVSSKLSFPNFPLMSSIENPVSLVLPTVQNNTTIMLTVKILTHPPKNKTKPT